ncbi:C1q and tumor necrosis factor-related protein-like protein 3 isoform b isoform 2 [Daphnia pulex]|uniref:C1q and tumor necrosis factor-related protein-like protein 3 isoform b isoform 2 n=1 Tax=Daphnia pulex TaxID=6669 RepID=E9GC21_DAPPU|nr:C1q and tumor necrosis factor-related protein-like protein 3 isoform b isoform 2 [Daphnia pulex]|eukprot:EFX82922.1 C1q and tumor necrosis factor-related protein-like protein 3 isoform b isoform 2 [Daphnia pulex]
MASSASVQLPSSPDGFLPHSPFYFYNPATLPTLNSHTSKQVMTYHDYPTSTLLGSHVVFLTTCLEDLKDSNQKLAKTSKLLEELKNTTTAVIENFKNELKALQNWIGYADVKSLPTYFYVQNTGQFSTSVVPIPFGLERLNIGGAMNKTTGTFTAPRKGVYYFTFSGVSAINSAPGFVDVGLMVNGVQIGRAECFSTTGGGDWETLTLQSTIELKTGDLVWLQIQNLRGASLQDNSEGLFTHFSGWLLQEDLSP